MRAIELFAGAGGLGLGVSQAGFSAVDVVEWDRWCCDTLRENRRRKGSEMSKWPEPREGDIRHLSFNQFADNVALVSGGPPCQPFSLGGRHKAFLDDRDMWPQAVRVVRETRPEAFIFENVKGLTRETFSAYFEYIVLQLSYPDLICRGGEAWSDHLSRLKQHSKANGQSSLRYRVRAPQVLNAANFGVPQKRERVFFVGFRDDLEIQWSFPKATHSRDALLWDQQHGDYWDRHEVPIASRSVPRRICSTERPNERAWLTTRDALVGLTDPELYPSVESVFSDHRFQAGARSYPGHTGSALDEPAKTLKAGVHGVPGGENMLRRLDGTVRYFTIREAARLQTFPDKFQFHGAWSETMRQLGNAVPVKLARCVASSVFKKLQGLDQRDVIGEKVSA